MNLKLFSLISSDDIPATKLQIKISGSLNAFTDDDVSFKRFSSLKEMFPSLGKALADSELIVIAVDPKIYVRTKTLLTKALSLDIEENPTVAPRKFPSRKSCFNRRCRRVPSRF